MPCTGTKAAPVILATELQYSLTALPHVRYLRHTIRSSTEPRLFKTNRSTAGRCTNLSTVAQPQCPLPIGGKAVYVGQSAAHQRVSILSWGPDFGLYASAAAGQRMIAIASIFPVADFVQQIGAERWEALTLLSRGGQCPYV